MGIGFDFSVDEVVLGIPALFEDILVVLVGWARLDCHASELGMKLLVEL